MKHRRVRALILAMVSVTLVMAQQACAGEAAGPSSPGDAISATGASRSADPTLTATPPPASSRRTTPTASRPATVQPPKTTDTVTTCRSIDMAADITFQPERTEGNRRVALVAITNKSQRTCTVQGRAVISLANAAGDVVEVRVRYVNEPGPAVPITLRPDRTVFQGIKWTACDKEDEKCGVGNALLFNLEASTDGAAARLVGFPAGEASDVTMNALIIGTMQQSAQGVVAW